jgi:hypothetical protein
VGVRSYRCGSLSDAAPWRGKNPFIPKSFGQDKCSLSTAVTDNDYHYYGTSNEDKNPDDMTYLHHCPTCTCTDENSIKQQSISPQTCYLSEPLIAPDTPLPPPLPDPNFSFRGRVLPPNLLAFNSTEGKQRFSFCLQNNNAEAYFPLSQQFLNQSDPAFCGVTTLILVLNALAMDPNVRWRGGWRWYGDESMLLERCCIEEERVKREGVSLEQYCGLARCRSRCWRRQSLLLLLMEVIVLQVSIFATDVLLKNLKILIELIIS